MRLQYVRGRWGDAGVTKVMERLAPEEARAVLAATPIGFYPLALNAKLDETICQALAGGRDETYEELGAYSAHAFAQEIYHSFYQEREPRRFIETTTHLYKHYYRNAGRRRNEFPSDREALMVVEDCSEAYRANCLSNVGFMKASLELLGARGVAIREIACVALGAADCRSLLSWKP